jgi:hypothetical protein
VGAECAAEKQATARMRANGTFRLSIGLQKKQLYPVTSLSSSAYRQNEQGLRCRFRLIKCKRNSLLGFTML